MSKHDYSNLKERANKLGFQTECTTDIDTTITVRSEFLEHDLIGGERSVLIKLNSFLKGWEGFLKLKSKYGKVGYSITIRTRKTEPRSLDSRPFEIRFERNGRSGWIARGDKLFPLIKQANDELKIKTITSRKEVRTFTGKIVDLKPDQQKVVDWVDEAFIRNPIVKTNQQETGLSNYRFQRALARLESMNVLELKNGVITYSMHTVK